jgi:hypothetical protein
MSESPGGLKTQTARHTQSSDSVEETLGENSNSHKFPGEARQGPTLTEASNCGILENYRGAREGFL